MKHKQCLECKGCQEQRLERESNATKKTYYNQYRVNALIVYMFGALISTILLSVASQSAGVLPLVAPEAPTAYNMLVFTMFLFVMVVSGALFSLFYLIECCVELKNENARLKI